MVANLKLQKMHEKNKKSNRQQSLTINSTENQSILSGHHPKNPKIVRETPQPNTNESRYGSQLAKLKLRKPLCKNEERPQQIGNHSQVHFVILCHGCRWEVDCTRVNGGWTISGSHTLS